MSISSLLASLANGSLAMIVAAVCGALVVLSFLVLTFNTLIKRRNDVKNSFGSIDVELKKRHDLIPNLVGSVQQFMKHEAKVLTELTALRSQAQSRKLSDNQRIKVENQITSQLKGLMVSVEAYPQLRSSANFVQLQHTLKDVEDQLSASRRAFNAAVTDYNNTVQMFPTNVVALFTGFRSKEVFEAPETERANPNVAELFKSAS